jgi:hypothetical protein
MRNYDLAKIAYDAYCKATGGVSLISGAKLPEFQDLRQAIQDAWWEASAAAGNAVMDKLQEAQEALRELRERS